MSQIIFARFEYRNTSGYGLIEDGHIVCLDGDLFGDFEKTHQSFNIGDVKLLAPCFPTKIVAVGLNYSDHAEELGMTPPEEPMLFLKPSTAVIGPNENIIYPKHMSARVDYEAELGVVIKKYARNIEQEQAGEYILGYTCLNDVTARDLQGKDVQFTRAKGFDTFAPIGPVVNCSIDPSDLSIRALLNGKVVQQSRTSNLIFPVPRLLSFISKVMTLNPGDIIATGTPAGIGPMNPGDKIEIEIEGIGKLTNTIS
jgi:2-keto-4-pentenoate hydratase/2-oxohepta-3-ene-1,7-dioic acid hydratase in catechol pathway